MQTDLGGNGACFVYFNGAGLHSFSTPSGIRGGLQPYSRQDQDGGLPLVPETVFWYMGQAVPLCCWMTPAGTHNDLV
jgi:hypothetical protein